MNNSSILSTKSKSYEILPVHHLGQDQIHKGFDSLVSYIVANKAVNIDGYVGVDWAYIRHQLDVRLKEQGFSIHWVDTADALKNEDEIDEMTRPFLGGASTVWGKKTDLTLADFFDQEKIIKSKSFTKEADLTITIGPNASSFATAHAKLLYIDLPKNELQYRMRRKEIVNLGAVQPDDAQSMYKRFYFVDWVVLNLHKEQIFDKVDVMIDGQHQDTVTWSYMDKLIEGLKELSTSVFRVKPWFEPGAWGGQWLKRHIKDLNQEAVNYAWSFELIVPENGLLFESNGHLLEISFDWLMFARAEAVLGKHVTKYGTAFPIRFDFLDTFDGGNLSIQCHPSLKYIREKFGERITQDETYYIMDAGEGASVYIGFQEDIDPKEFRKDLMDSQIYGKEVDIERYVQKLPAEKHDLFLIPNGTVHSAGKNNLVLEISATPYIFTFKMYDWLRMDLDGKPRPINIDHAFQNLDFNRKGSVVEDELKAKPYLLKNEDGWQLFHYPTHAEHFYDVHQIVISTFYQESTENACRVLMLVDGARLMVETADGVKRTYNYAETFVIPAAAGSYTIINLDEEPIKVVKAFLK
ncbi:class I mannose-6-phosphate isomerase [Olivibacter sp. SDN3]|uniref:class I mannose-6-phosphate isomerase n=1 Tax=Olivibacter sp. SDN3 TaxID=2764720 RepID=UPI00165127A5|nr:class I mannose-6-phosphate isomerase [Olivibacter sp. SDN3]QNL48372.1 class I mannose-6-phosphate isomerase [Olivibacter sp. SDN3]